MTGLHPTAERQRGLGTRTGTRRRRRVAAATVASSCLVLGLLASQAGSPVVANTRHHHNAFVQVNLVSDLRGVAQLRDTALKNPWGIAAGPNTPLWVNNAGDSAGRARKIQLFTGANGVDPITKVKALEVRATTPTAMVFNDDS